MAAFKVASERIDSGIWDLMKRFGRGLLCLGVMQAAAAAGTAVDSPVFMVVVARVRENRDRREPRLA